MGTFDLYKVKELLLIMQYTTYNHLIINLLCLKQKVSVHK